MTSSNVAASQALYLIWKVVNQFAGVIFSQTPLVASLSEYLGMGVNQKRVPEITRKMVPITWHLTRILGVKIGQAHLLVQSTTDQRRKKKQCNGESFPPKTRWATVRSITAVTHLARLAHDSHVVAAICRTQQMEGQPDRNARARPWPEGENTAGPTPRCPGPAA